jgi:hypothetical protein
MYGSRKTLLAERKYSILVSQVFTDGSRIHYSPWPYTEGIIIASIFRRPSAIVVPLPLQHICIMLNYYEFLVVL